jgi:hypothetical protein
MKTRTQYNRSGQPYSALLCVAMLLAAGMLFKFGPALHLNHMIHNGLTVSTPAVAATPNNR